MTTGITAVGDAPRACSPAAGRGRPRGDHHLLRRSVRRLLAVDVDVPAADGGTAFADVGATNRHVETATERDPENVTSWQQLGGAYLHRAIETADPAFYNLSGRALDRADALLPHQANTDVARGALLLSLHEFGQARDLIAPISAPDPFDSDALAVLVDANVELGRYDDAETTLQQLLDLRPGLPAYSRTSYLRELHGDLVGAQQSMRLALTAGAGDRFDVATVTTFLGDLAFGSGDLAPRAPATRRRSASGPIT